MVDNFLGRCDFKATESPRELLIEERSNSFIRAFTRLDGFIQITLEFSHFVAYKTECVVQGEPLHVFGVFLQIVSQAVEFGQNFFNFHGA